MNLELLKKLCMTHGVTGDTSQIEMVILECLKSLGITPTVTGFGTIVFGNLEKPKKLIAAHIDEVGFQITKIEDDGKIRILPVGWVFANRLDHSVIYISIGSNKVKGLVLHQEILKTENLEHFNTLFIDIGANSKDEVEKMGVKVGQTGSYQKEYWENNGSIISSGMDNRVSVFTILEILKDNPEVLNENMFAFITDEEMYDHSANGLGDQFKPDFAVILDYCPVHQKLGEGDVLGQVGKGPIIAYRGGSHIIHQDVRNYFDNKIKSQFQKGFLSANTVHQLEPCNFQNNGHTKAVNICLPAYGYHGAGYSVRRVDLESFLNLVKEVIATPFSE